MAYWNDLDGTHFTLEQALEKVKLPGFHVSLANMSRPRFIAGANIANRETRENYAIQYEIAVQMISGGGFYFVDQISVPNTNGTQMTYKFGEASVVDIHHELLALIRPYRR